LSTTAIGTILDGGTCSLAGKCLGGSAAGGTCLGDFDCPSGTCATAVCEGICSGGDSAGKACLSSDDCPNGSCAQGANFNTKCAAADSCGGANICVPVDVNKGYDGLPCTDDDSDAAKGKAQTIPQTTGRTSSFVGDVLNVAGAQMVHGACTSIVPSACVTTVVGSPFNCASLTGGNPTAAGSRLASSFPSIDTATTGDGAVTTLLTAK
jgi:hypothetical protein